MIVDLQPTEEQTLITSSLEQALRRTLPVERLRHEAGMGAAAERTQWQVLVDFGLFGLGLPTSRGGLGYGLPEEALAARIMGRYCISPTVLATMLSVHVAASCGREDLRMGLQSGAQRAAFANPLDGHGSVQLLDATGCDWLLLLDQPTKLLARAAVGTSRGVHCIDESVHLERAQLDPGDSLSSDLEPRASLLLAAYLVGNAQATLDMAVGYANVREQFGQPIGAFQAIKHSCADMAVRAAAAEAQTLFAAVIADAAEREAASARLLAGQAAIINAKANIQIHGAMGFTAECDAHLFLKRALLANTLGTDASLLRERILSN
jgi:alkylation response protein AidB-like acyl-CoA dehydrogenase